MEDEEKFVCGYCQKIYSSKWNLTRHQNTAASCLSRRNAELEDPYKCRYCKYSSGQKSNVEKHEVICKQRKKTLESENQDLKNALAEAQKEMAVTKAENVILKDAASKPRTSIVNNITFKI